MGESPSVRGRLWSSRNKAPHVPELRGQGSTQGAMSRWQTADRPANREGFRTGLKTVASPSYVIPTLPHLAARALQFVRQGVAASHICALKQGLASGLDLAEPM